MGPVAPQNHPSPVRGGRNRAHRPRTRSRNGVFGFGANSAVRRNVAFVGSIFLPGFEPKRLSTSHINGVTVPNYEARQASKMSLAYMLGD